jgi:hypothetical protein
VPVTIESVGIRNSIFGIRRHTTARRAGSGSRRTTGPITKPMKRSIPVHNSPARTWRKWSALGSPLSVTAAIPTKASKNQAKFASRIGGATSASVADAAPRAAGILLVSSIDHRSARIHRRKAAWPRRGDVAKLALFEPALGDLMPAMRSARH